MSVIDQKCNGEGTPRSESEVLLQRDNQGEHQCTIKAMPQKQKRNTQESTTENIALLLFPQKSDFLKSPKRIEAAQENTDDNTVMQTPCEK